MDTEQAKLTKKPGLAAVMPRVAEFVEARRKDWGRAYVDGLIKRAMKGEVGCFYAMENAKVIGAPIGKVVSDSFFLLGLQFGVTHFAAMVPPTEEKLNASTQT